jgi:hypothetical protein
VAPDDDRERLRDLSRRVLRLHKLLLDRERHTYEARLKLETRFRRRHP